MRKLDLVAELCWVQFWQFWYSFGINLFVNSRKESLPVFWPRFSSAGETTMLDRTDVVG